MEKQQPLHVQFFEDYVQLLRMRLEHYHSNNGGAAKFVNNLIITPHIYEDSYYSELKDAKRQVLRLNEYLHQNIPVSTELTYVSLNDDLNVRYYFNMYIEPQTEALEEFERIHIELNKEAHSAGFADYDDVELTVISDEVWRELLNNVQGAISFGTLCMT